MNQILDGYQCLICKKPLFMDKVSVEFNVFVHPWCEDKFYGNSKKYLKKITKMKGKLR